MSVLALLLFLQQKLFGGADLPVTALIDCGDSLYFSDLCGMCLHSLFGLMVSQVTQNMALAALALLDDVMGNEVTEIEGSKWLEGGTPRSTAYFIAHILTL